MNSSIKPTGEKVKNYSTILNNSIETLDEFVSQLNNVIEDKFCDKYIEHARTINENILLLKSIEEAQKKYEYITVYISKTFDSLKIEFTDIFENQHFLFANLGNQKKIKITKHSLPEVKNLLYEYNDISTVVDRFYDCLNNLSDYLKVTKDMDMNCWIIDPEYPTFKDNYRRIVINDNVSALINIDIYSANSPPCIKLLGPSKHTDPLLEKLHQNITKWDSCNSFLENLLYVFDLSQFLINTKTTCYNELETGETECCICFSTRDETGLLPSIQCERTICRQKFHPTCLYQWLLAVSNNVQRLNTIHGECPCCSAIISCSSVKLKN